MHALEALKRGAPGTPRQLLISGEDGTAEGVDDADGADLRIAFLLPAGSYVTVRLREIQRS